MNRRQKRAMVREIKRINRRNARLRGGISESHWLRRVKLERSTTDDESSKDGEGVITDGEPR